MDIWIGKVIHYYTRLGVAAIHLSGELKIGDAIVILGHTTELIQGVHSMEIDHKKVLAASSGCNVAIQVIEPVRVGDSVYLVTEPQARERLLLSAGIHLLELSR
jgi:hypothetical protein